MKNFAKLIMIAICGLTAVISASYAADEIKTTHHKKHHKATKAVNEESKTTDSKNTVDKDNKTAN